MFSLKKKNRTRLFPFKIPTAITILFLLIFLIILISWIPGTTMNDKNNPTGHDADGKPISLYPNGGPLGIFDLFLAPVQGFLKSSEVIIFILVIGGYLAVVLNSKALDAGIGRLVKKMNGKEIWIIPTIMIILAIGGTVEGMCEETIPYYVIIIPVLMAAGFDVITGVFVILLGAGVGVMFSTLNPFAIATASSSSDPTGAIGIGDGLPWRFICWLLGVTITISFVMWYAIRVKKNPELSATAHLKDSHEAEFLTGEDLPEFTRKRKIILTLFGLTFLIMIMCIIPWSKLIYGAERGATEGPFNHFNVWMKNHFPYIFGNLPAFGNWTIEILAFLFFFASIIIALIDWKGEAYYTKEFITGSSELLGVALIIAVAGGIGWTLETSGMQGVVLKVVGGYISSLPKQIVILLGLAIFLLLAFFIPSTSGLAKAAFPVISPVVANLHLQTGMITAFTMASGWINLFAPSAGVMMAGLAIAKVPLNVFYKAVWPFIVIISVFMVAMLLIGTLMPKFIF